MSSYQTILVYPPILANENQRSTVRMSSHLVFITLTTSVQWLFTIIPTGELWKNKVHQKNTITTAMKFLDGLFIILVIHFDKTNRKIFGHLLILL